MKPNVFRTAAIAVTLIGLLSAHPALAGGGKNTKGSTTSVPKGTKAKHLTGEATIKSKDQSKIDFEAADIGGERKSPLGTMINQNKADKNYDFVKIRLRWHPEMVQSASALDSGK